MFEFMGVPQKCSFLQSYLYSWFLKSFQFCPILSNLLSFKKIVFKFYRNLASCYNILGNNGNQLMYTSKTALYGDSPKRCGDTYVQLLGVGTMGTFFSQENYGISKPFFTVTNWDIFLVSRKTKTLKKFKVKEKEITNKPISTDEENDFSWKNFLKQSPKTHGVIFNQKICYENYRLNKCKIVLRFFKAILMFFPTTYL